MVLNLNIEIPEIFNELNSDNFYIIDDINSLIQSESLKYINKNININFSDKLKIAKNIFQKIGPGDSKVFYTIKRALCGKKKDTILRMFDVIGVKWKFVEKNLKKHDKEPIYLDDFISAFDFKSNMNDTINNHTNYPIDVFNIIRMFIDNIKKQLKETSIYVYKQPYTLDKLDIIFTSGLIFFNTVRLVQNRGAICGVFFVGTYVTPTDTHTKVTLLWRKEIFR